MSVVWILSPRGSDDFCCECKPSVCDDCCECLEPTLLCDSIQASLSKCGFAENPGYESVPPKIYRTRTWAGSITGNQYNGPGCIILSVTTTTTYSGSCSYSGPTCAILTGDLLLNGSGAGCGTAFVTPCGALECPYIYTGNTITCTGDAVCRGAGNSFDYTGTATDTLSVEYTTAELKTNTIAALPSYPDTWDGDCSALLDIDSDQLSCTIRQFKYKFALPDLTLCTAYHIHWLEGDNEKSYTWNGSDTETPTYTVEQPAENGTIEISDITYDCDPDS